MNLTFQNEEKRKSRQELAVANTELILKMKKKKKIRQLN
jgi:hypothetical protein